MPAAMANEIADATGCDNIVPTLPASLTFDQVLRCALEGTGISKGKTVAIGKNLLITQPHRLRAIETKAGLAVKSA
ncbi:MAG: hypothetical protein IPH43_15755 [Xanthomonadales bacterium]|nr:hypothetical protein [Xanthomonadales bacterium]